MQSFQAQMDEYHQQLQKGAIQKAYQGLMEYISALKTYLADKYPGYIVSGSLYFGYMDMTYFSFHPRSLKEKGLKVAIVFIHEACRFEAWLAGYNRQVQTRYWKLLKESGWDRYPLVPSTKGVDAIIEHTLVANPDFQDLEALTRQIEAAAVEFIKELEASLPDFKT